MRAGNKRRDGGAVAHLKVIAPASYSRLRMSEPFRFTKEMAETRASLARGLVRLIGVAGDNIARGDSRLEIVDGDKRFVLEIEELPARKFGPVELPVLQVTATLEGYAREDAEAFKRDFERAFQRGGG